MQEVKEYKEFRAGGATLAITVGDITEESTDAIVNAANTHLSGGSGVDGAIHRAGGPQIMDDCRKIGGCPTGSAVITSAGMLKCRFVIHAVGPIYKDGRHGEPGLLRKAYESSLSTALENGLKSVSFPAISTGAYSYPKADASRIAISAVKAFVKNRPGIELVRFVLFSRADYDLYLDILSRE